MSETKRTKRSTTRRAAGRGAVDVMDKVAAPAAAPAGAPAATDELADVLGDLGLAVPVETEDGLDDILGEILPPAPPAPVDDLDALLSELAPEAPAAPVDELDALLGELAPEAPAAPVDELDDLLGELAPEAPSVPVDELDDLLGELAPEVPAAPVDELDDLLGELALEVPAAPADELDNLLGELAPAPVDDLDDLLGELAPAPAPVTGAKAKAAKPAEPAAAGPVAAISDDFSAMLDEMAAAMPEPIAEPEADAGDAADGDDGPAKPPLTARLRALAGPAALAATAPFRGKREISRLTFAGMVAAIGALGTAVVGQATYIVARPSGAAHHAPAPPPARTIVPVDYSKVDMTLYHDKVRALPEGGRDMLRNPAIKEAVLYLDNGEMLYDDVVDMARGNAAADRVDIRDDQVTISSCEGVICPSKSFKLIYRLQSEDATVCVTERTGEGLARSYSYGPKGYREWPSCDAVH